MFSTFPAGFKDAKEKARKVALANIFAKEHLRAFLRTSIGRFNKQNKKQLYLPLSPPSYGESMVKQTLRKGKKRLPWQATAKSG